VFINNLKKSSFCNIRILPNAMPEKKRQDDPTLSLIDSIFRICTFPNRHFFSILNLFHVCGIVVLHTTVEF
jgi:hypothetical protein